MSYAEPVTHTTMNLSTRLIREAQRIFRDRTKTEIIREALERLIAQEKAVRHFKKWAGKGRFRSYE